jgi:hypothetical protein
MAPAVMPVTSAEKVAVREEALSCLIAEIFAVVEATAAAAFTVQRYFLVVLFLVLVFLKVILTTVLP